MVAQGEVDGQIARQQLGGVATGVADFLLELANLWGVCLEAEGVALGAFQALVGSRRVVVALVDVPHSPAHRDCPVCPREVSKMVECNLEGLVEVKEDLLG